MTTHVATVLIPAKDEEQWIADCLASVAAQDYPHHLLEVIVVVDADSGDQTSGLATELLEEHDFARAEVIRTTQGSTPRNLNAGLALARGDVLCRVDARSRVPPNYVRTCVAALGSRDDVAVIGGAQVAIPSRPECHGTGIARALNNRLAMGWSRYRRGSASGASDTVYLGAFRTADLHAVGGWSIEFSTNQDFDLNRRMRKRGLVWFDATIPVQYVPRASIHQLFRQYVRFGSWKVRYWRQTGDRPRPRQVALLAAVPLAGVCGAVAVARSRRPLVTVASAAAAALAVEALGTSGPPGGVRARLWALAGIGAVAGGWLWGAWRALLGGER